MFEMQSNTNYDNGINLGRAIVFMNRNYHAARVDFIYEVNENGNLSFHYENGTCLTDEEKTELENWFITTMPRQSTFDEEKEVEESIEEYGEMYQ